MHYYFLLFSVVFLRPFTIILYSVFLFIVVIILLNVLIAQMSDTYSKVLSTAEGVYLFYRCRYIARLEKHRKYFDRNRCCIWLGQSRIKCLLERLWKYVGKNCFERLVRLTSRFRRPTYFKVIHTALFSIYYSLKYLCVWNEIMCKCLFVMTCHQ